MKIRYIPLLVMITLLGFRSPGHTQTVLYADSFDRSNNADLDAGIPTGQSGAYLPSGGFDWIQTGGDSISISGNAVELDGDTDTARIRPDVSFIDSNEFTVRFTLDWSGADSQDQFALSIGDNDQDLENFGGVLDSDTSWSIVLWSDGDCLVYEAGTQEEDFEGSGDRILPDLSTAGPVEIEVTVSTMEFSNGTSASVVFSYDGTEYDLGDGNSFTWTGSDNYIQLEQQRTDGTIIDDFEILGDMPGAAGIAVLDTFDRSNNSDIDGDIPTGQSGDLLPSGGMAWLQTGGDAISINSNHIVLDGHTDTARISPDYNFTDSTEFTVSFTLDWDGAGSQDLFGLSIGDNDSVLDNFGPDLDTDTSWGIFIYSDGDSIVYNAGTEVENFEGSSNRILPDLSTAGPVEVSVTVTTTEISNGTSASVVFTYDGTEYDLGDGNSFTWTGSNNYIQLEQQRTDGTFIDDFQVTTTVGGGGGGPPPSPPVASEPHPSWAPPLDQDGWSILTPSSDSRLIYVSDSSGNDSTGDYYLPSEITGDVRNPTSSINPYKTIDAAMAVARDGYPDWILLESGDVFIDQDLQDMTNGRDEDERKVVTWYGTSGDRPVLRITDETGNSAIFGTTSIGWEYWAIVGLKFYFSGRDPDHADFPGWQNLNDNAPKAFAFRSASNMLFEDCVFMYWGYSLNLNSWDDPRGGNYVVRRCMFLMEYDTESSLYRGEFAHGIYGKNNDNMLLEENLFDYNGQIDYPKHPNLPYAGNNQLNHSIYIVDSGGDFIVKGNIFARSAHSVKASGPGGWYENNLFLRNALSMGVGWSPCADQSDGFYANRNGAYRNVVLEGHEMDPDDFAGPNVATIKLTGIQYWLEPECEDYPTNFELVMVDNVIAHRYVFEETTGWNGDPLEIASWSYFEEDNDIIVGGNVIYDWKESQDMWNEDWVAPERSVGDYNNTLGGTATTEAFLIDARDRDVQEWLPAYSADGVNDYIWAGFDIE